MAGELIAQGAAVGGPWGAAVGAVLEIGGAAAQAPPAAPALSGIDGNTWASGDWIVATGGSKATGGSGGPEVLIFAGLIVLAVLFWKR